MVQQMTKRKVNKRSLKKKIRKTISLSISIYSLLFIVGLVFLSWKGINTVLALESDSVASKNAAYISSNLFLNKFRIHDLTQFNPKTPQANEMFKTLEQTSSIQDFLINKKGDIQPDNGEIDNIFEFRINFSNRIIYKSQEHQISNDVPSFLKKINSLFECSAEKELYDSRGMVVGTFSVRVVDYFISIMFIIIAVAIYFAVIFFSNIVSAIIGRVLAIPLLRPINQMNVNLKLICDENLEDIEDVHIDMKKPPIEIENMVDSTNTIIDKVREKNKAIKDQYDELEAQNKNLLESNMKIENAQNNLYNKEKAVRTLLDNVGQGFIAFGETLIVDDDYSAECNNIFGLKPIAGQKFSKLISDDEEQSNFLESIFKKILSKSEPDKCDIYLSLLPNEVKIENRNIKVEYKFKDDIDKFIVILTDITEKHKLEIQMENEKKILKMIVKVVSTYSEFIESISDYEEFYSIKLAEILNTNNNAIDALEDIFRNVHTLKGNLSQFDMVRITEYLHNVENELNELRYKDDLAIEDIRSCMEKFNFKDAIDEDLNVLKETLGDEFFEKNNEIVIDRDRIEDIENKMLKVLPQNECKLLIPDIRSLRFKPIRELFKIYPEYTMKLADRMGKMIKPIEIEGGDFLVDDEMYHDFSKSVVHIFRNLIDHGIETVEERLLSGKNEYGEIKFIIDCDHDQIQISISDDGSGMDIEKIKQTAVDKGLYSQNEIESLDKGEIINLVFKDGFTTNSEVTYISGRGVGLAAVSNEVKKLGGKIKIETQQGVGTKFIITLPRRDKNLWLEVAPTDIINSVIVNSVYFLEGYLGKIKEDKKHNIAEVNRLKLVNYSSFMNVNGAVNGRFVITADKPTIKVILSQYLFEDVDENEEDKYIEDMLAEMSNVIFGNSLKDIKKIGELLRIDSLTSIFSEGAAVSYSGERIFEKELEFEKGTIKLAFITEWHPCS